MTVQEVRAGRPRRVRAGLLLALLTAAALVPAAVPAQDADADWKPVTVLYQTDVKGKIEPCG